MPENAHDETPRIFKPKPAAEPVEKTFTHDELFGDSNAEAKTFSHEELFGTEPVEERGLLGDIGSNLARGVADTTELAGHALKTAGAEKVGDWVIDKTENAQENASVLQTDKSEQEGENFVKRGVMGGVRSMVPSGAAAATGFATGAAMGSVVPGVGNIVGGLVGAGLGTLGLFGAGVYGKEKQAAIDSGLSNDEAHRHGLEQAVVEGGIEAISTPIELLLGGIGKVATQPLKQSVKELLKTPMKQLLKNYGKTMAVETGTEMVQGGLGNQLSSTHGLAEGTNTEAVLESIIPAMTMSLMFGMGSHAYNAKQQSSMKKALANGEHDPQQRAGTANAIYHQIAKEDPELAEAWVAQAQTAINAGTPIDIDQDFAAFANQRQTQESPETKPTGTIQKVEESARDLSAEAQTVEQPFTPTEEQLTKAQNAATDESTDDLMYDFFGQAEDQQSDEDTKYRQAKFEKVRAKDKWEAFDKEQREAPKMLPEGQGFELLGDEQASDQRGDDLFQAWADDAVSLSQREEGKAASRKPKQLSMPERGFELVDGKVSANRLADQKRKEIAEAREAGYITDQQADNFNLKVIAARKKWAKDNRNAAFNKKLSSSEQETEGTELETELTVEAKKEAESIVRADPRYQLMNKIKRDGGINLEQAKQMFSPETVKQLNKQYPGLLQHDSSARYGSKSVSPDEVAQENGYDSANDMMNDLVSAPSIKAMTKKLSDQKREEWTKYDELSQEDIESEPWSDKEQNVKNTPQVETGDTVKAQEGGEIPTVSKQTVPEEVKPTESEVNGGVNDTVQPDRDQDTTETKQADIGRVEKAEQKTLRQDDEQEVTGKGGDLKSPPQETETVNPEGIPEGAKYASKVGDEYQYVLAGKSYWSEVGPKEGNSTSPKKDTKKVGTIENKGIAKEFNNPENHEVIDNPSSLAHGEEMNTNPTEGQKEAENYKTVKVTIDGLNISIENPAGSTRSGTDPNGKEWSIVMENDYGRILGSMGFDKDHVDIFVAPSYQGGSKYAYVINQHNKDGKFDEHKTVLGVESEQEALDLYNSNYEKGWDGGKSITRMPLGAFKKWVLGAGPSKGALKRKRTVDVDSLNTIEVENNLGLSMKGKSIEQQKKERAEERAKEKSDVINSLPVAVRRAVKYIAERDFLKKNGVYVDSSYRSDQDAKDAKELSEFRNNAKRKGKRLLSQLEKYEAQDAKSSKELADIISAKQQPSKSDVNDTDVVDIPKKTTAPTKPVTEKSISNTPNVIEQEKGYRDTPDKKPILNPLAGQKNTPDRQATTELEQPPTVESKVDVDDTQFVKDNLKAGHFIKHKSSGARSGKSEWLKVTGIAGDDILLEGKRYKVKHGDITDIRTSYLKKESAIFVDGKPTSPEAGTTATATAKARTDSDGGGSSFRSWRVQGRTVRHSTIGSKISPAESEGVISLFKDNGFSAKYDDAKGIIRLVKGGLKSEVDTEIDSLWDDYGSSAISAEKGAEKRAIQDKADTDKAKEMADNLKENKVAVSWIEKTFSNVGLGDYNKLEFAKFLNGENKKPPYSAVTWKWTEDLEKIGAIMGEGEEAKVDFEKIKSIYDLKQPTSSNKSVTPDERPSSEMTREEYAKRNKDQGVGPKNKDVTRQQHDISIIRELFEQEIKDDAFARRINRTVQSLTSGMLRNSTKVKIVDQGSFNSVNDGIDKLYKRAIEEGKTVPEMALSENPELKQLAEAKAENKAKFEGFNFSKEDIPYQQAYDAHAGTSHVPDERAVQEQNMHVSYMESVVSSLQKLAKTEDQKNELDTWFNNYYYPGYLKRKLAMFAADSRTMSSMITGPANFPVARNKAKLNTAHKRSEELLEFDKKAKKKIRSKILGNEAISSTDPEAITKLKTKLAKLEKAHQQMKDSNKILRSKKTSEEEKILQMVEAGLKEETAKKLMVPNEYGRNGFESFSLTNSNATIKTVKGRIAELEKRAAKAEETGGSETQEFEGGSVELNHADGFVRVFHDEKPEPDVRAKLKSNGFRWSPRDGAWRRKISNQAKYKAEEVTGVKFSKAPLEQSQDKVYNEEVNPYHLKEARGQFQLADKLEEALNFQHDITPWSMPDSLVRRDKTGRVLMDGVPQSDFELTERLSTIFGKKVIWANLGDKLSMNGLATTSGPLAGNIFIDPRTSLPANVVYGHELAHHLEVTHPRLYNELYEIVSPLIVNVPQYRNKLNMGEKTDESYVKREIIADLLGDSFNDPTFWNEVANESPSKFRKIARKIRTWIDNLLGKLKQNSFGSERYTKDLQATRKALTTLISQSVSEKGRKEIADSVVAKKETGGVNEFAQDAKMSVKEAGRKIKGLANFEKWFKGSRIVDENGGPLVVYHGTMSKFDTFKPSGSKGTHGEADQIEGIYFTDNKDGANWYALKEDDDRFLKQVYVSIKNPYMADSIKELKEGLGVSLLGDVSNAAKKMGHDGVVVEKGFYSNGGPWRKIIAFEPTQIKSIFNQGEWSKSNPDILKSEQSNLQTFLRDTKVDSIVYHGSPTFGQNNNFTFDRNREGSKTKSPLRGLGFFFTEDKNEAMSYAGSAGQVESLHLRIENPLEVNSYDLPTFNTIGEAKAFAKRKQLQGHDGIYLKDEGHWIAFESNQAKSEDKNNGEFDPSKGDVRYSVASVAAPFTSARNKALSLLEKHATPEVKEKLATYLWDQDASISRVQKEIGKQPEARDYNLLRRLTGKKVADEIKLFDRDKLTPLLKDFAKVGVDFKDTDQLSWAEHAPERNLQMKRVNAKRYIDSFLDNFTDKEQIEYQTKLSDVRNKFIMQKQTISKKRDGYIQVMDDMSSEVTATHDQQLEAIQAKQDFLDNRDFTQEEIDKGTPERAQKFIDNSSKRLERRKEIAEKWEDVKDRLSGMTAKESKDIIDKWKADSRYPGIRKIVDKIREINEASLDMNYAAGELTKEEYTQIKKTYKYHVPLYREDMDSGKATTGRAGRGPLGKPIKIAAGSTRGVVDIFAHVVDRYQSAINRKHKLESERALYEMVKGNPDESRWEIVKPEMKPTHDSEGNIRYVADYQIDPATETQAKVDGKIYVIAVSKDNKAMMRWMQALNREPVELGPILKVSQKATRFLAQLNTSFSPEFILSNFSRDIQTAGIHLETTAAAGMQKKVFKNIKAAIKGIYKEEREQDSGEWGKLYRSFARNGGKIGWMQGYENVEELATNLEGELAYQEGKRPKRAAYRKFSRFVEAANTSVENGVRLATYKTLLDNGVSENKAAHAVANLTVDFTRHGTVGPVLNSLYMFAGAGIQGNIRMLKALGTNKKVQKIAGGIVGFGFMANILGAYAGGDDEDGESFYDKLKKTNPSVFERNMIFMIPGSKGKYIKIPMPYGYNTLFVAGNEMGSALRGGPGYSATEGMARLGSALMGTFNPLGSATLLQTIMPTVGDPIAQVMENKSWSGNDLMPSKNPFGLPTPDSERFWKSVNPLARFATRWLNDITGGSETKAGLIDVSPETVEMIFETITGSLGRVAKDTLFLPITLTTEGSAELHKVPFVRKVAGSSSQYMDQSIFRGNRDNVAQFTAEYNNSDMSVRAGMKSDDRYKMMSLTKSTDKRLRKLRKRVKQYESIGDTANVDRIKTLMNNSYKRYNLRYNQTIS